MRIPFDSRARPRSTFARLRGVGKLTRQRLEFQFAKQLVRRSSIGRARFQLVQIQVDVEVGLDPRQFARLANQLGIVVQRLAIRFVLDLFPMRERILDRTEVFDQLDRALRADAGRAGNVVDRITHQAEQIDNLIGGHTELLLDPGFVAPFDRRARIPCA